MKYVIFTDKEKIAIFDEIADHFYNANFGQMSKADIELMMFHFYIEKLISANQNADGTIDYNVCSDYKISKELGITQQRVKNLKIKSHLIYPIKFDWELALAKLTENAHYDKSSKKVILNIPDPNLYIEIQNFIEETGAYIEKQLNSKILQIRAEYYIELILHMEPEESRKRAIKKIKEQFKESGKEENHFDERKIGESLIKMGADVTTIFANIASILSAENLVGMALKHLLEQLR